MQGIKVVGARNGDRGVMHCECEGKEGNTREEVYMEREREREGEEGEVRARENVLWLSARVSYGERGWRMGGGG